MLKIPEKNTYEFDNINFERIDGLIYDLQQTLFAYTKKLLNTTGIGNDKLTMGVTWKRLRSCLDLSSQSPIKSI